ncbi:MAG: class I SAM-dependent methyltransferase [Caldilineaceae bacterium]|nr:class I SAM-dependent methyltransferase [Caldilineaceae bacterium]
MTILATDPAYLAHQYSTAEKLRIRQEAHSAYSVRANDFFAWAVALLDLAPGLLAADVGCGPGVYHPFLHAAGCRVVGIDASWGMVTETQRQARRTHLAVHAVQASAEDLPLAAARVDRLLANHMLYHVADQRAALREMWRVLRPGGVVLLATNAPDAGDVLYRAHCDAARTLGYTPAPRVTDRFHLGHQALVQEFFPDVAVHVRRDAFVFPTLDTALRYYLSGIAELIEAAPADGSHVRRLTPLVRERLSALLNGEGKLHVPKDAGCFVARKQ